ncbi:hypothetical protein EXIGLDRAFT_781688 [Exidia glandulosa HHB12029]|uniref:Uncharacterized protein n=1 Tax=Exidia glandulosa HHB12029 TaxID=1314781 RepID=A0A165B683_EXIGL|nr:hypothetical protein EXIGLDRAFT_781688 [Exidia glandulosa HHB12029]
MPCIDAITAVQTETEYDVGAVELRSLTCVPLRVWNDIRKDYRNPTMYNNTRRTPSSLKPNPTLAPSSYDSLQRGRAREGLVLDAPASRLDRHPQGLPQDSSRPLSYYVQQYQTQAVQTDTEPDAGIRRLLYHAGLSHRTDYVAMRFLQSIARHPSHDGLQVVLLIKLRLRTASARITTSTRFRSGQQVRAAYAPASVAQTPVLVLGLDASHESVNYDQQEAKRVSEVLKRSSKDLPASGASQTSTAKTHRSPVTSERGFKIDVREDYLEPYPEDACWSNDCVLVALRTPERLA